MQPSKNSLIAPSSLPHSSKLTLQQQKIKQILLSLQQKDMIRVHISFKFKDQQNRIIPEQIYLIPLSYTLLQLQSDIRKKLSLKSQEGIFLYIANDKIAELRTTIKEIAKNNKLIDDKTKKEYIQITVNTIEKFG